MGKEIIAIAEALSNERAIPKEKIFEALETALATATKKKYNVDIDVRVDIDRREGGYTTYRRWRVVDTDGPLENPAQETSLAAAREEYPNISADDIVEEEIPSVTFDRITIQTAKQVLSQRVKSAEREQLIAEQRSRLGHVVSATVKRPGREFMILDLGNGAEGILRREQMIPHETFGRGERIRVLLIDIKSETKGPQLVCSRTAPEFLAELFRIEVPEIGEGVIEIMGVARDPGSRAKIAVRSKDRRVDPRGACIGMRGARVMAVSNELSGERIDVVLWDENLAQYVTNAMEPAEVSRIVINDDNHTIDLAVAEDNLALAIGRNGQNVRLASQVLGWSIKVKAESEMDQELAAEAAQIVKFFVDNLDIDEEFAQVLADAGFHTLEEVAYVPAQEFLEIEGLDEELVAALQENARQAIANHEAELKAQGADELMKVYGIDTELALSLSNHGIKSLEDLAEQATDDLVELGIDEGKASRIIMGARNLTWFKEEYEAELKAQEEARQKAEQERLAYEAEQEAARMAYEADMAAQGLAPDGTPLEQYMGPNGEPGFMPGPNGEPGFMPGSDAPFMPQDPMQEPMNADAVAGTAAAFGQNPAGTDAPASSDKVEGEPTSEQEPSSLEQNQSGSEQQ